MTKVLLLSIIALFSSYAFAAPEFLKVVPGTITGYSYFPQVEEKIQQALPVIEAVINSEEFKKRVISYKGDRGYTSSHSLSNAQVYDLLMTGNEILDDGHSLSEMNFDIERYKSVNPWSSVIAYTLPGEDNIIRTNQRKYVNISVAGIAGNLTHEWIHLMGFLHDSANDYDSVPYAVGKIMEELATKYLSQGYLD